MTSVSLRRRYIKKLARAHLFGNAFCIVCASLVVFLVAVGLLSLLDAQYGFFSQYAQGVEKSVLFSVYMLVFAFALFPVFCGYKRFIYLSFTEKMRDLSVLFHFFQKQRLLSSLKLCSALILKSLALYFPALLCFLFKQPVLTHIKTQHTLGNMGDFGAHFIPALYVIFSFFLVFLAFFLNLRYALCVYIFVLDEEKSIKQIFAISRKALKSTKTELFELYLSFLPLIFICTLCIGAFLLPFTFSYFNLAKTAYLCYFHAAEYENGKEKLL